MTSAPVARAARVDALVAACLVGLAAGMAGALGWRWFAILALDVPPDLAAIDCPALVLNVVVPVPVVGNGLGYWSPLLSVPSSSWLSF